MTTSKLQETIKAIFDYSYTNSPIRLPEKTCIEVGKIIHVGMYIEECDKKIPAFDFDQKEIQLLDNKANDFSSKTAKSVRHKFDEMNQKWKLYEDGIAFTDVNIAFIVSKLNLLVLSDKDRDILGDALEIFRSKWAKQEGGQFFTDQRVTSLAIEMLQFNPAEGHDLVDLCAGTGGFLMAGLNKIKKVADLENKNEKYVVDLACKSLKGIEIDSHVANLGNATFRTRTGDRKESFIVNHDSLKLFQLKNETKIKEGCHIKAATNPPFGAKITIKDPETLINYDLAKISNSNCDISNATSTKLFRRSPDILFIEQNIKILKAGEGQLAIIVPYQILSGPQVMYVRNWILKNTKVISIVDLPSETFQPHTGTKTALLVVERLKEPLKSLTEIPDYNIFMGIPKWIGHDRRGNPVYKKSPDGMETSEILSDFNEIEKSYKNYIKTGKSLGNVSTTFTVKVKDIIKDNELHLNASFYNPDNINKQVNLNHNDFDMVKLHELVDRVFCPGRFKRNYVSKSSNAVPFLGGSNITQLVNETDKWLKKDDPKLEQLAVKSGWLLITRSGTTGIISSVPELWNGYAISEHVIRIVPNTSKISPYYLLAYLKSPQCQAALSQGVFGSVIDEITPSIVENLDIPVPKDKKLYNRIVSSIEDAENARSLTLNNLYGAIDLLNEKLCA